MLIAACRVLRGFAVPQTFSPCVNPAVAQAAAVFSMRYRLNTHGSARLGLAISKRVSRRAVERNRIKRLVRESFRRMRMQLPPMDVMVMARQEAVSQSGPDLLAELHELWGRLAALKPPPGAVTIER